MMGAAREREGTCKGTHYSRNDYPFAKKKGASDRHHTPLQTLGNTVPEENVEEAVVVGESVPRNLPRQISVPRPPFASRLMKEKQETRHTHDARAVIVLKKPELPTGETRGHERGWFARRVSRKRSVGTCARTTLVQFSRRKAGTVQLVNHGQSRSMEANAIENERSHY